MDKTQQTPITLNSEEEKEYREGMALKEMWENSEGWRVIRQWLEDRAYHTWISPIGKTAEDWNWENQNAFHAANNAKELIEDIQKAVDRADYLSKVKSGEITTKRMRI